MTLRIATANRLADGTAVYLAADGAWTERIAESVVARDDAAEARLMSMAEREVAEQHVVGPYLIEIVEEDGGHAPARLREAIRATGPTVATLPGREMEGRDQNVRL